jgi:hypothetical protein
LAPRHLKNKKILGYKWLEAIQKKKNVTTFQKNSKPQIILDSVRFFKQV